MKVHRKIVLLAVVVPVLGGVAEAQHSVIPLAIEDAVGRTRLRGHGEFGAISPDGALLAYAACDSRRVEGDSSGLASATISSPIRSMGCEIRVTNLGDGTTRTIATDHRAGHWGPSWSPDGRQLALYSDRDGAVRIWIWDRATGRLRRAAAAKMDTRTDAVQPLWTPDGKALIVQLLAADVPRATLAASSRESRPPSPTDAVSGATVRLYRSGQPPAVHDEVEQVSSGEVLRATKHQDLGVLDLTTGRIRRLRSQVAPIWLDCSPDGRWLAYLEPSEEQHGDEGLPRLDLRIIELATGRERTVATQILQALTGVVTWAPNSQYLGYVSIRYLTDTLRTGTSFSSSPGAQSQTMAEVYVVAVEGSTLRRFRGAVADYSKKPLWDAQSDDILVVGQGRLWRASRARDTLIEIPTGMPVQEVLAAGDRRTYWSPDGGISLHALTSDSVSLTSGYIAVDLRDGTVSMLLREQQRLGEGSERPVVTSRGDAVVYLRESAGESPDIWIAGTSFQAPRRLTRLNPQFDRYKFGQAHLIQYQSLDGALLRGALLLPADYEPGRRFPLVTWVYASTMGSRNLNRFGLWGDAAYNLHMLTTRGYAVLWPDIPVRVGTPMQDLMKAVMPAIDKVVELGIADPERLAVMGQSNGGYSTLALLVQTTRFKAAVMNAGFGDLVGFYGAMNAYDGSGGWQHWLEHRNGAMGVPPWEAPLRYVENSPVFYLDRVQTPLIIQAGEADAGIVQFSDQVFVGLRRLQKDVTYLRYGGEGHVLAQYPNLVDYWRRVTAFLDEKVKGSTPADPTQLGQH